MPFILYLFALTNLVIGTGAFVLSGILQPLAGALGVSVGAAGQAMTVYALASAFAAPLLLTATGRWPRKRAILLALALFAAGSVLTAMATSFTLLLVGRFLMGLGSMFSALASGVAVALVAPAQRGKALSLSFIGISLSYAIGLPLGTWLGFRHGWQAPVWLVALCCIAMLVLLARAVPSRLEAPGANFSSLGALVRQWTVLRVWLRTLLYFVAIFSVFAYIGPVLQALNPMPPSQLALTLVFFGLSGVAGTLSGGWAVDRFGPIRTLRVQLSVLASMMALVPLTQGHYGLCVVVFVVWGIAGFGMMAPQQVLLASHAPQQAPLLLSLNGSMLYAGTALGALVSGALSSSVGLSRLSWVGLPFALVALATLWMGAHAAPPSSTKIGDSHARP